MPESLELNYQQSSVTANPMKKFDTEMFQTDMRELSKELSDLAEDLISIHEDIQDFCRNILLSQPRNVTSTGEKRQSLPRRTNEVCYLTPKS
nr:hypothetical transcript [Hymenolepis microstoma]